MKTTILAVFSLLLLESCEDLGGSAANVLSELPEVVLTQTNYLPNTIHTILPTRGRLQKFAQAYAGNYSESLKQSLAAYAEQQACVLGLSRTEFARCLAATGQQDPSAIALIYRAERARYDLRDCWVLEFACSHSDPASLGHYRCFVIDVATYDVLLSITCR